MNKDELYEIIKCSGGIEGLNTSIFHAFRAYDLLVLQGKAKEAATMLTVITCFQIVATELKEREEAKTYFDSLILNEHEREGEG